MTSVAESSSLSPADSPTDSPTFTTSLHFATPDYSEPNSEPYSFATVLSTGKTLQIVPKPITPENLRVRLSRSDRPALDVEGYEMHTVPYPLEAEEGWDSYVAHMCDWLRNLLRAEKVVAYNYALRQSYAPGDPRAPAEYDPARPEAFDPDNIGPVPVAHVDGTAKVELIECCKALDISAEKAHGRRIAVINIWRPLNGPVVDTPLALCDTRTVRADDFIITTDYYGEGSFLRYDPRHRWAYLRDQTPDEILVFRCFDSRLTPDQGGVTPHAAFLDQERRDQTGFFRRSIEVRCSVLY